MKPIKIIMVLIIGLAVYSCTKNQEGESRNSWFCSTCEAIDISLEKIQVGPEGCCKFKLSATHVPGCNTSTRQSVHLNGEWQGVISGNSLEFFFDNCPGEENLIEVFGKNEETGAWDILCFSQVLDCEEECTCNDLSVEVTQLDTEPGECCAYLVTTNIESQDLSSSCTFTMNVNGQEQELPTRPGEYKFSVCNQNTVIGFFVNGRFCTREILSPTCSD